MVKKCILAKPDKKKINFPPEPSEEYRSFPASFSNKSKAQIDPCPIRNFRGCTGASCTERSGD